MNLRILIFVLIQACYLNGQNKTTSQKIEILKNDISYEELGIEKMLQLSNEVYLESIAANNHEQAAYGLVKMLEIYYNTYQFNKVFLFVDKAKKETLEIKDYYNYCKVLRYEAWALINVGRYSKAKEVLKNIRKYSELITDKNLRYVINMITNSTYASLYESYNTNVDSMLYYSKEAYKNAISIDDTYKNKTKSVASTANVVGNIYVYINNYAEAKKYISIARENYNANEDKALLIKINKSLASISVEEKNYDLAINYLKESLVLAEQFNQKDELNNIYPMLSKIYTEINDHKNANLYMFKFKNLNDSLQNIKKIENDKLDIKKQPQSRNLKNYLYYVIGSVVLVFIVLFYIKRRNKIQTTNNEANRQNETEMINDGQMEENDQMNDEILPKLDGGMSMEKNEPQNTIVHNNNVEEYVNYETDKTHIINKLVELAKQCEKSFYAAFDECFPTFKRDLVQAYPKLNNNELKLLSYIRLNFQTKEIAIYTNSTIKSIESKKYRIRKKLELNTDENIYLFISRF